MAEVKEQQATRVVTGVVRLSYAHVWKPVAMEDSEDKKYSTAILIPKSDTVTVNKIKKAVEAATALGVTSKWDGKKPPKLKTPLRDGDEEKADDPNYEGMYFLSASAKTKPGIIDLNKKEITDEDEVYSGAYARVSLNFYPFNTKGNKGVGAGLNNIQKVKDGEPFGGKTRAEDDFDDDFALELNEDDDDDMFK